MTPHDLRQRHLGPLRALSTFGVARPIEPLAHFLAGLEERNAFLIDRHMSAGARIAARACRSFLHRKCAETAQLDAVAVRHGRNDLVEDGIDDVFDVALIEMRILRRDPLNQLRLDHGCPARERPPGKGPKKIGRSCWSVRRQVPKGQ